MQELPSQVMRGRTCGEVRSRLQQVIVITGVCVILALGSTQASAEKAYFSAQGASSMLKLSDGGNAVKVDGSFTVRYKDFVVNGSKGEFQKPPEGKQNATTRLRVIITKDARVTSSGPDAFELTAQKLVDMDLERESIVAQGSVQIKSKKTVITANQLDSADNSTMQSRVTKIATELGAQYTTLAMEWLEKADPKDRLMLLEGDVKATDPEFAFSGQKLVVNITKEVYLFLGPHELEINVAESEASSTSSGNGA